MTRQRIMIVDDHAIVLDGLRSLLEGAADSEVVAAVMSGGQAIIKARELEPDVVVMDFHLEDMDGVDVGSRILAELPSTRVFILSVHEGAENIERARRAGIEGWVSKNASPQALLEAVAPIGSGAAASDTGLVEGR